MDAVALLSAVTAGSVGAIVTEPPALPSSTDAVAWLRPVAAHAARVLRPGGAAIIMGAASSAWEVAANRVGLAPVGELTVLWNDPVNTRARTRNFGSMSMPVKWHVRSGARYTFNVSRRVASNVIIAHRVPAADRHLIYQKPVELTNLLVSLFTREDDLVVDPFCGSGSTLVSAAMCGRRWLGGDSDPTACDISQTRAVRHEFEESDLRPLYLWCGDDKISVEEEG